MRTQRAFTILELIIVVMVIGLLTAIAVPNFMKSRDHTRTSTCAENRRVLDYAKELWMIDNEKVHTDEILWKDIVPEYVQRLPKCPISGVYNLQGLNEDSVCSVHGS